MGDEHSNLPLTETLAPADEAAVAAAVRNAARSGTPVYPLGGGTLLDRGLRPTRPGIGLSLTGLNRIVDHQADDMTITVEAGVTVAQLSQCLAARRQRLPVDVAAAERATIGGVLAANASGPRRYACGTIRDYIIGIRAVDGEGMAFAGGGHVVKNAAGYNLPRLMVGSLGTLAVITQVTLMVRPMPETSAFVTCDLPDFKAAERLLAALVRTQTLPTAIELLAGPVVQAEPLVVQASRLPEQVELPQQPEQPGRPHHDGHAARLLVAFEGSAVEVEWMIGQLRGEWRELGVDAAAVASGPDADRLWNWLVELPADEEIVVRPSETVELIAGLRRARPGVSIQSHAGDGVVRVCGGKGTGTGRGFAPPSSAAENATSETAPRPRSTEAAIMRAIKERFDPQGIFSPGRIAF